MKKKNYFKPVTEVIEISELEELLTAGSPIRIDTDDDDDEGGFIITG
jgi:hypothetical protein